MPWNPNFKKGTDLPTWDWLSFFPGGVMQPGFGTSYDGKRYIYIAAQIGSATVASTTQLWRYDTWTEGWQFLSTLTSSFTGIDLEYDPIRELVYISTVTTGWQIFNPTSTAATVLNVTVPPMSLVTAAPVLPAAIGAGGSFTMPDELAVMGAASVNGSIPIDMETIAAGSTATVINVAASADGGGSFGPGLVGLYVRITSGALSGQRRLITAINGTTGTSLTVAAFASAPAAGVTMVVEVPELTATSGAATTITVTAAGWTVNQYANADVVIVAGTGNGQRRRIASNDATTLTLAAAYVAPATNPRVGPWAITPDATSVFRIVPSSDFLYYQPGGTTAIHRIDLAQTGSVPAWSASLGAAPAATGGGGNTIYAGQYDPFAIICIRGVATSTIYRFSIGTNVWTTLPVLAGGETFTTGASSAGVHGKRRIYIQKEGTNRTYFYDVTTGMLEAGPTLPYAAPTALEGKRARFVKTPDGVEWIYHFRAGGQECFRVALEWLV